jgi:hypothetical protein
MKFEYHVTHGIQKFKVNECTVRNTGKRNSMNILETKPAMLTRTTRGTQNNKTHNDAYDPMK